MSYDISNDKTRKREINGLLLAAKETKCENLLLLTDHESGITTESGHQITIQPVYEWSLELGYGQELKQDCHPVAGWQS